MHSTSIQAATISDSARQRFLALEEQPFLISDWVRVMFFHYKVDVALLQREVPFELGRHDDAAWVSLVAFTMLGLRFQRGGRLSKWLCWPMREQRLLNLRTYVRHAGEAGIYFIAEWLSHWPSVWLGPVMYGLPYRRGRLKYWHERERGCLRGCVEACDGSGVFAYEGGVGLASRLPIGRIPAFAGPAVESSAATLDEFLLERYTAYTCRGHERRRFRIWHEPWQQERAEINRLDESLLSRSMPWWSATQFVGANYSPGCHGIWMGRPRRIELEGSSSKFQV